MKKLLIATLCLGAFGMTACTGDKEEGAEKKVEEAADDVKKAADDAE